MKSATIRAVKLVSRSFSEVAENVGGRTRKVIRTKDNRPIVQSRRTINEELDSKAAASGLGWRICAASILHRFPLVTPSPEPWELDMKRVQDKIDAEKRKLLLDQVEGTPAQMIPARVVTPEEIIESLPFKPAGRVTDADLNNDRKAMDRRVADSLYLIVKRNRKENAWQFPQGRILDTEIGLRTTAERVSDRAAANVRRWFVSNAPIGHLCYAYPKSVQDARQQFGAKIYYYRAQYIAGNLKLETRLYKDYAWIARDEVGEYFNEETAAYLKELLPY